MTDEKNYKLLSRGQAAEFLGLSKNSFDTARKQARFPAPIRMIKANKWRQSDLEQYIEASEAPESESAE